MVAISENRYAKVGGHRIRYVEAGTGAPVVMLHGLGFNASADQFAPAMELLSERYRTIAVDNLGWGHSDRPVTDYSFPLWVDTLVGLLDDLGIERASLVGHTLGGWVCALVAHQHPERVDKLVLVNNAGLNPTAPTSPGEFRLPDRDAVQRSLERTFEGSYAVTDAMVDDEFSRQEQPGTAEAYAAIVRYVADLDIRAEWGLATRLPAMTTPTLVVWGDDDPVITPEYGRQAADLLPNGNLVLIKEGAHIPLARKPKEFAQVVTEFLG